MAIKDHPAYIVSSNVMWYDVICGTIFLTNEAFTLITSLIKFIGWSITYPSATHPKFLISYYTSTFIPVDIDHEAK